MDAPEDELVARLEAAFEAAAGADPGHDIHHARRVARVALQIARSEGGGDRAVILAAAYLHDLVNLPKDHPDRASASRRSADAAAPILAGLGFDAARIAAARHAILAHAFSAGIEPETLEARAIQDADRLEALGAIGLARVFAVSGGLGRPLFDGEDPFARDRPLDDRRFALDHFAVKLLGLPERMRTAAGRSLAHARLRTMRRFLVDLAQELGHGMPW
jgi:uncharacterized protein